MRYPSPFVFANVETSALSQSQSECIAATSRPATLPMRIILLRSRLYIAFFLIAVCQGTFSCAQERPRPNDLASTIERGREFLVHLVHPELHLLPEFEGHRVIWLYHDNYLASKVLERTHPQIAGEISTAIRKYGVSRSGKIELLFGEAELPMHQYELRDVANDRGFLIRSEFTTERKWTDVSGYADLLLFVAIADKDKENASKHFRDAIAMWDGKGLNDRATKHSKMYATYKLALTLIAADKHRDLQTEYQDVLAKIRSRLISMQSDSGGWITDYTSDGTPVGFANVETTCMAIMALETPPSRP